MTNENQTTGHTPLVVITDESQVKSIKKALPAYREYATIAEAQTALESAAKKTDNFHGLNVFYKHPVDSVNWNYTGVIIARMGKIADSNNDGKKTQGIASIVVIPTFTVADFMADIAGETLLAKILSKELRLVHMRSYREALTIGEFEAGMTHSPASVIDYATASERGGNGMDMETFNDTYQAVMGFVKQQQPVLTNLLPNKSELVKCLRSASYAVANYDQLENNDSGTSIFDWITKLFIAFAESEELDATTLTDWRASRDEVNFTAPVAKDYGALAGFSLEA